MSIFAPSFQLPEAMSASAANVDALYSFIFWLSVVLFVGIMVATVYFVWVYRKRPGHKAEPTGHNLFLQIGLAVAPIPLLVGMFHWGFKGYMDMSIAPAGAMEVRVRGFQGGWEFEYPGGETDSVLHVPVNRPVKLIMSSSDVLHSFYVPQLRVKRDLVPGMFTSLWFQPDKTGKMDVFCTEYCGGKSKDQNGNELAPSEYKGHWSMLSQIVVDTQEDFDKYIQGKGTPKDPVEFGKALYTQKGCNACHSVDGSVGVAPSWKGLWARSEPMLDGSMVTVDGNYLRESIVLPSAKIVKGYGSPSIMPSYQGLKDKEIDAIIEYMKTLK